jgi:outer membrane protein assembly factor BamB
MPNLIRLILTFVAVGLSASSLCEELPLGIAMQGAQVGWRGKRDGLWHWPLPATPNGMMPTQSWHATASSPDGDIYVGGMDHATNAALYRLRTATGVLSLVGDAKSASEAVRNWMPGETAQKFHTRPLWHRGKIFVATMDRSSLNDEYLGRRGFHWYAYDPEAGFTDLSASEPGGTAVPHGNLVTLASDSVRNFIYGAGVPTGEIVRYDVARGRTEVLGRPEGYRERYVYTNRVMWIDSRGRLYFSASNPKDGSVHDHLHYYDPETRFGERRDWPLVDGQALEVGQCVSAGKRCFFSDDRGHVYRFDDDGPAWTYLGQLQTQESGVYVWLFQATADGEKAYMATSTSPEPSSSTALYEFDLKLGSTRQLCSFADMDPALRDLHIHTGYSAWDREGRFYFTSFNGHPNQPVILTRVDPARLLPCHGRLLENKPGQEISNP